MQKRLAQHRTDFATLAHELPSLSLEVPSAPRALSARQHTYLHYYGLHLAAEFPAVRHDWGALSVVIKPRDDVKKSPPAGSRSAGTMPAGPQPAGDNNFKLAVHLWAPPKARDAVIVVHGYLDHVGLYGPLLRHLLKRGLAVLMFDLPGHGLSSGARATIRSFDRYVAAFDAVLQFATPHLPPRCHLLAQSTGASIAMEWLLQSGSDGSQRTSGSRHTVPVPRFASITLLSPLVRPAAWRWLATPHRIAKRWVRQYPRFFTANTDNPAFNSFVRDADPLQATSIPVQWVSAMQQWHQRFERYPPTDIAVRVLFGQRDRTICWRHSARVVRRLFRANVQYLRTARHHLVNESPPVRKLVFAMIDDAVEGSA